MTATEIIDWHGGPARLAEKMKLTEKRAIQRIHNWRARGVPSAVQLKFPELFPRRGESFCVPELPAEGVEASA